MESLLNYPVFWPLRRAMSSPSADMMELRDMIVRMQAVSKDVTVLGTFLE